MPLPMDAMKKIILYGWLTAAFFSWGYPGIAGAWNDETHLAIARAAGYHKWYNAAVADMAKLKAGDAEAHNHYVNNPPDAVVTPRMAMDQIPNYNRIEAKGHLYGAIMASLRLYRKQIAAGKYGEYHMAYCAHYVGDLSMPLHNIVYNDFNRTHHSQMDGIINDEVLENYTRIDVYPISIESEADLAIQIARIANLSIALANRLESERRQITRAEAYHQISHSASLLKAILKYGASPSSPLN
jgi:hypothetical protein